MCVCACMCSVFLDVGQNVGYYRMYTDDADVVYDYRKQIQEINWQRKNEQTEAGAKLKQLEER